MAKGQMKSNKETRKPKKDKAKPARLRSACQQASPPDHLSHWRAGRYRRRHFLFARAG